MVDRGYKIRERQVYKSELRNFIYLALISPAIAITYVFKFKTQRFFVTGSMLVMGLFGLFFSYPKGSDGQSHLMNSIDHYSNMGLMEFFTECWNIVIQQPTIGPTDLYIHFLSFFSNSIFQIPYSLHFWAGIILGYFISKTILLILEANFTKITWKTGLPFLIILFLIHSIYSLNAIRISTGGWVLLYATVGYFLTNKRYFLLFFLLSIQIHLAFVIMVIPAIASFFIYKRKSLVIGLWILTFFFQASFSQFERYLPETEVMTTKTRAYVLDEDRLEDYKTESDNVQGNFYATFGPRLYFKYSLLILVIAFLFIYYRTNDNFFNFLVTNSLLFFSFSNVVSFSPSLQGRLMNMTSLFLLFGVIYYFKNIQKFDTKNFFSKHPISFYLCFPVLILAIPYLLKNISHIINTTEPFILVAPMLNLFFSDSISIKELIITII